jgi:quercetin dioxygenase-like cupin family protein
MKVSGDVITLGPRDAVFLPPQTPRATRNDGDAPAVFAMVSTKVEDPMAETNAHEDFWL